MRLKGSFSKKNETGTTMRHTPNKKKKKNRAHSVFAKHTYICIRASYHVHTKYLVVGGNNNKNCIRLAGDV